MRKLQRILLVILAIHLSFSLISAELEEGTLTTEPGVEIYWRAMGEGPALIVPGAFLFRGDLDRLANTHRLILYDMRNRGRSSPVADAALLTIEGDVRDLEAIRDFFDLSSFSSIGYSYLGKMIVLYALAHPERIERLVQIGPVPMRFGSQMPSIWDNTNEQVLDRAAVQRLRALRAEGLHEKEPRRYCEEEWQVTRVRLVGDPALAERLDSWCESPNEWPIRLARHLQHHFVSAQKADVSPLDLVGFVQPVLTVHGTKDRNAPYAGGREWAAMLPNARLRTVEGGAHQAWLDDPVVLDDIAAFLSGQWPERSENVSIALDEPLSQLRGVETLERIATRYRDVDSDPVQPFSLKLEGDLFVESQSRSSRPPYDPFRLEEEVLFASGGKNVVIDEALHWPDFISRYRTVFRSSNGTTGKSGFELDLNARRVVEPYLAPRESWLSHLVHVPAYLLAQLLVNPGEVRLLGIDRSDKDPLQVIRGRLGDSQVTLGIDREGRIRRLSRIMSRELMGDGLETFEWEGEQKIESMVVPRQMRRYRDGVQVADLRLSHSRGVDLSLFEVPDGYEVSPRDIPELAIEPVAQDVWIAKNIGGADYRSLVVVHDDGLVLLETPQNEEAMREVIVRLREKFGPLPIKAALVTHHHFDHSGGVRAAMVESARIVVPAGSEELFRTIASAPRTLQRESKRIDPWTVRIEGVERASIEPRTRGPAVEVFSLGENEHAEGMLFAWLPEYGILFQGDLYVKHGDEVEPAREQGVRLLERIRALGIEPRKIIGVHGEVATMEDLTSGGRASG